MTLHRIASTRNNIDDHVLSLEGERGLASVTFRSDQTLVHGIRVGLVVPSGGHRNPLVEYCTSPVHARKAPSPP